MLQKEWKGNLMENPRIKELAAEIDSLSYQDKKEVYSKTFSTDYIGGEKLDDKLILISLITLTYFKLREKNPKVTPIEILEKITKEPKGTHFYKVLENLSIMVEDLSYGHKIANSCGLKTSQEIINKIKELVETWIPF